MTFVFDKSAKKRKIFYLLIIGKVFYVYNDRAGM